TSNRHKRCTSLQHTNQSAPSPKDPNHAGRSNDPRSRSEHRRPARCPRGNPWARVTATASSAGHSRRVKLGAAHGVDYHDPTWVDAAAATSGADGFDAAVN